MVLVKSLKSGAKLFLLPSSRPRVLAWGALSDRARSRSRYRFPGLQQKPSVVAFALFFFSPSDTLLTSNGKSSRTSTITRTIQGSDAHPPDQPINRFVRVDKLLSSPSNFGRGRWRNRGSNLPSASSIFDLSPTANPQSSSSFVVVLVLEFWPGRREIVSSDPKTPKLHHSITPSLHHSGAPTLPRGKAGRIAYSTKVGRIASG